MHAVEQSEEEYADMFIGTLSKEHDDKHIGVMESQYKHIGVMESSETEGGKWMESLKINTKVVTYIGHRRRLRCQ